MKTVELGSQGLKVSVEGLGCMGMSTTYGPSNDEESLATLRRAIQLGITYFDTAQTYGPFHNEELLGRAFASIRDRVVISTKVGFGFTDDGKLKIVGGKPVVDGRPEHIVKAIEGGVKPSQLALAWTIAQGGVPIPGTRRIKYLEENVAAADIVLSKEEMAKLDEVAPVGVASGDRYSEGMMSLLNK
jgi:aryl-alcohol dehydrogenase-like predicted oxidoreductase